MSENDNQSSFTYHTLVNRIGINKSSFNKNIFEIINKPSCIPYPVNVSIA